MKHKTIKKSIIIIMVITLLLTCVSSLAATVTVDYFEINYPTDLTLTPDNVVNSQPDQATGTYYITYKASYNFYAWVDGLGRQRYWNGLYLWNLTLSLPNAYTVKSISWEVNPVVTDHLASFGFQRYQSMYTARFITAFTNYYTEAYIPLAGFDIYITIQALQTSAVPAPTINLSLSIGDVAGSTTRNTYPEVGKGLAGEIGFAILNSLNTADFNEDIGALLIFAASQEGLLEDVLEELQEANIDLGDIVYYLNNTQNARLQTIISKIQELIDMGRQDTQAQNDLNAAASQMEGAAAAMNVTKPNMNAVIPQTLADADAVAAQGTIFSWLNNSYIIAILSAMMTIALIGFVLYGKSG